MAKKRNKRKQNQGNKLQGQVIRQEDALDTTEISDEKTISEEISESSNGVSENVELVSEAVINDNFEEDEQTSAAPEATAVLLDEDLSEASDKTELLEAVEMDENNSPVESIEITDKSRDKEVLEDVELIEDLDSHDPGKYDEHGFAKFIAEMLTSAGSFARKNITVLIAIVAVVILVTIVVIFVKSPIKNNGQGISVSDLSVSGQEDASVSSGNLNEVPVEALVVDGYEPVNSLVLSYFNAMQNDDIDTLTSISNGYIDAVENAKIHVKTGYVEEYRDIVCNSKAGPFDNSYIVYVQYSVKLKEWEQTVPSLLTLVVCTADDGSLYVYNGEFDENIAEYIKTISSQDDVVDLITKVDAEYKEVLDADPGLSEYMGALNQTIKNEVGELIAASAVSEDSENDELASESENEADNDEPETFEVKAVTTVNVRMSDSEDADKLGKVEGGTILTCYEERPNGWSKILYDGASAYIKTEYLERLDNGGDDEGGATVETNGTVTVAETVNIRDKASTDGQQLGVAYQGESFSLVEKQNNGWTKILYNGKEAYIKTEYLK